MTIEAKTKALLGAIERRLTDISEQQHALAVERARLLEQLTPLRLGIVAPDTAVVQLKAKGVTLGSRRSTASWAWPITSGCSTTCGSSSRASPLTPPAATALAGPLPVRPGARYTPATLAMHRLG